jgi:uncharacterized RDD family membrane protein YckC
MSNMPDDGATGEQRHTQQTASPDVPAQPAAPPPMQYPSAQQQPVQEQMQQPVIQPSQARQATEPADTGELAGAGRPVRPMPIPAAETKVSGRRVVQYIIDYVLAGIVPALAYWLFDSRAGSINGVRWLLATIIALAAYFAYWVAIPYGNAGQTFGMKLLRLRVISTDGGRASMMQLFVRGVFLIIDTLVFGLVGYITMLCSRYRQRVGDHAARTLVVPARYGPQF